MPDTRDGLHANAPAHLNNVAGVNVDADQEFRRIARELDELGLVGGVDGDAE